MYDEDEIVDDLLFIISALAGFIFWSFNNKVFLSLLIIFFMNVFLKIIKHKYGSKISYVLNTPVLDLLEK